MSKSKVAAELREEVKIRANFRCEYCLMNSTAALISFHVDHIISEKQGGSSESENLCYACANCNRYKGASIVAYHHRLKKVVLLFNPRMQIWDKNFRLLSSGKIESKSEEGEGTIRILQMNRLNQISRRKSQMEMGLI